MSEPGLVRAPELSVVLATDSYASIRKTLHYFRAQGDPARLEIVIAALGRAPLAIDAPEIRGFPHVRIVPVDAAMDLGHAEVAAFRATTAPLIVFAESCAYPCPGYVDAVLAAFHSGGRGRVAVVGPVLVNANPATATSWAAMWINYTPWVESDTRGPAVRVVGHNSVFERRATEAVGHERDELMRSLTSLQRALRARGGAFAVEPSARVEILNVSRPGWFVIDQFGKGRTFALYRRRRWSRPRRLLFALGVPLIPLVRSARIAGRLRRLGRLRELGRGGRSLMLVAGLVASSVGELVGYLVDGSFTPEFYERNLHRPRYLSAADARRDADERTWPAPGSRADHGGNAAGAVSA